MLQMHSLFNVLWYPCGHAFINVHICALLPSFFNSMNISSTCLSSSHLNWINQVLSLLGFSVTKAQFICNVMDVVGWCLQEGILLSHNTVNSVFLLFSICVVNCLVKTYSVLAEKYYVVDCYFVLSSKIIYGVLCWRIGEPNYWSS